ncbi:MAG TPA: ligase-associated DNA damage response endonuclease PdeM [Caulobacteraceae bacterium]|nr:ligase-associated DNA damage response endonuclease PdeM [Caulobacteraceae bacterium]
MSLESRHASDDGGGAMLRLTDIDVTLRPSGALWIAEERVVVVADLHLEKGSAYAVRGQLLPPYDTRETLARLTAETARLRPRALVLLGDSFHDGRGEARLAEPDANTIRALAAVSDLVWVVGNHDADGPRTLPGAVVSELGLAGLTLVHEPAEGPRRGEIAGHLHPCAKIKLRSGSVRRRCFATDGERLVLPAFGAYAGGLNVRDEAFARLFRRRPTAVALGDGRTHTVGWELLRDD